MELIAAGSEPCRCTTDLALFPLALSSVSEGNSTAKAEGSLAFFLNFGLPVTLLAKTSIHSATLVANC